MTVLMKSFHYLFCIFNILASSDDSEEECPPKGWRPSKRQHPPKRQRPLKRRRVMSGKQLHTNTHKYMLMGAHIQILLASLLKKLPNSTR